MVTRIQSERQKKGLRSTELAKLIGVAKQTVCEWEKGRAFPRRQHLVSLAKVFGVTTDYLLKLDDKVS